MTQTGIVKKTDSNEMTEFVDLSRRYLRSLEKNGDSYIFESTALVQVDQGPQLVFNYNTGCQKPRWKDVLPDTLNVRAFKSTVMFYPFIAASIGAYVGVLLNIRNPSLLDGLLCACAVFTVSFAASIALLKNSARKNLAGAIEPHQIALGLNGISVRWIGRLCSLQSGCFSWKDFELAYSDTDSTGIESLCLKDRRGQILRLRRSGFSGCEFDVIKRQIISHLTKPSVDVHQSALIAQPPLQLHISYVWSWFQTLRNQTKNERARDLPCRLSPGSSLKNNKYTVVDDLGNDGQSNVYIATWSAEPSSETQEIDSSIAADCQQKQLPSKLLRVKVRECFLPPGVPGFMYWRLLRRLEQASRSRTRYSRPTAYWLDHFVENRRFYSIEELVEEPTIEMLVNRDGKFSEEKALNIAISMTEVLFPPDQWLNAEGISDLIGVARVLIPHPLLHGKLSPTSFAVADNNSVRLMDFRLVGDLVGNNIFGSDAAFLAPEQIYTTATMRGDIYSLGAIIIFMLTGEKPTAFDCESDLGSEKCAHISGEMRRILLKAVSKERSQRYVNSEEMWVDLKKLRGDLDVMDEG